MMMRLQSALLPTMMLAFATAAGPATASGPAEPLTELRVLVSHGTGGGYDTYARLFARHVAKHLAGSPTVVVQNMPGAAGVVMANYLGSQAPKDGTVIGVGPGSIAGAKLLGSQGAKYEPTSLSWIGSLNSDVVIAVSRSDAPVKTFRDVLSTELIVAGVGSTDNSVVYPSLLNALLGTRFRLVSGYKGSAETVLALERGEVQGIGGWSYASAVAMKPDWLRNGTINILVQLSLTRHSDLPNVPTVMDFVTTPEQRAVFELIFSQSEIGRIVVAPPGLSPGRLQDLRQAFDAVVADNEFRADAERSGVELNQPRNGLEVEQVVAKINSAQPETVRVASEAIAPK